jgi:hypothetical protein
VGFVEKKPRRLPRPSSCVSKIYTHTHTHTSFSLRSWKKFIAEKEGQFCPTITFYTDYPIRKPNNNFRLKKNKLYNTYIS